MSKQLIEKNADIKNSSLNFNKIESEKYIHPRIQKLKKREYGDGLNLFSKIKLRHRGDPRRQANEFFDNFEFSAGTGRKRNASIATRKAYKDRFMTFLSMLGKLNMPIQNLDEITGKQVRHVFHEFEAQALSPSWVANVNTTIRRFGIWLGKPEMCPPVAKLVEFPSNFVRKQSAKIAKDWDSLNIDFDNICADVERENPVTALQMQLSNNFGTRVQEFLMFRPQVVIFESKDCIYLKDGTKGGRARFVPIETQKQRELVEKATKLADPVSGILIAKPGYSLRQAINHYNHLVAKVGITKRELGITTHGLRHGYACGVYKEMTGVNAPVLGGGFVDPVLDKKARVEVANRLGHSRIDITSAYLGNFRTMNRERSKNLRDLRNVLETNSDLSELVSEVDIDSFYLLGAASKGEWKPKDKTPLLIGYSAKRVEGFTQASSDTNHLVGAFAVCQAIQAILHSEVTFKPMSAYLGNDACKLVFSKGKHLT